MDLREATGRRKIFEGTYHEVGMGQLAATRITTLGSMRFYCNKIAERIVEYC